jgi:hypothetical protein
MDRGKKGMRFYWGRYVECKRAIEKAKTVNQAGNWPSDIPRFSEEHVIEDFIGKSAWHQNYGPNFDLVDNHYPELKEWLNLSESTVDENKETWGIHKDEYTFVDLKEFLENEGKLHSGKPRPSGRKSPTPVPGKGKRVHQSGRKR